MPRERREMGGTGRRRGSNANILLLLLNVGPGPLAHTIHVLWYIGLSGRPGAIDEGEGGYHTDVWAHGPTEDGRLMIVCIRCLLCCRSAPYRGRRSSCPRLPTIVLLPLPLFPLFAATATTTIDNTVYYTVQEGRWAPTGGYEHRVVSAVRRGPIRPVP